DTSQGSGFGSALASFVSSTKFVPLGFSAFLISCFKFFCIIPIVLQKFALSMKNAENLDAKELLEVPCNRYTVSHRINDHILLIF
ncbi:MAG: hypothetical protein ACQES1_10050, partial [Bacteroidota bacterium]